jgi:hypothetical protein
MKNKAGRTPVALAFGEHPGHSCGVRYGADREFFRSAVLPFLEEHAVRRSQRVMVIHEFNIGLNLTDIDRTDPAHAGVVRRMVEDIESRANAELKRSLGAGEMPRAYRDWFDWGYLERIAEINRMWPGRIANRIEPLEGCTVWRVWDQTETMKRARDDMRIEERIGLEIDILRQSIGICLERSRRVVEAVKMLRLAEPDTAVVIPRGYAHKGMAGDFDASEFEVDVASGLQGVVQFPSEAIAESFSRDLSEDELRRYAMLSLMYDDYVGINSHRIRSVAESQEPARLERVWEVSAEARRHALDGGVPDTKPYPAARL